MIEPIIIDGKVKNCEVLFECNSVDDLASFKMIREGVEITPDNAPVFNNFDIKLIAEPRSPYGFSSLFKRNENIDEWEYMGFGHSGACSVVTALLKQLQRANYQIAEDENLQCDMREKIDELSELLKRKTAECEKLKEEKQDYCFNCDVAERMRKVVHAATGGRLSYANYTVDAIEQAYHDQLEIDVEYRTKILKEENAKLKAECEELKKKKEENETFYLRKYANKDSECLELQHKLRIATEALDIIANQNFNTPNKICNLAEKELVPCTNNCKYCLQAYAQRALEQIESEEQ